MSKKIRIGMIFGLCIVMIFVTGCRKKSGTAKENPVMSKQPVETEVVSSAVISEEPEVPLIDLAKLEELKGIPWTVDECVHNLYKGMMGKEEVILDLWFHKETQEAQISFVGDYHSEKMTFSCELTENGICYDGESCYFLLRQQKNDRLTGYFYERGQELLDVTLELKAINYSEEKEHLYTIGSDKEVEEFAQKVLDSINGYDFKAFSKYVSFPIRIHVNQAVQQIETRDAFEKLGEEVVFTDGFTQSMAQAYPNLMFSNAQDGVMLGGDQFNVWIHKDDNGELKVVAINN